MTLSNIGDLTPYLDQREKKDLDEARKSLLVGKPTTTIMTAIRAVEHLLRRWYEKKTGQQVGRKTWGQILDEIGSNYEEEKGKIGFPEYLKEKKNKIMHPEESPTLEEAEYTFHMVLREAIPMLLTDLKNLA